MKHIKLSLQTISTFRQKIFINLLHVEMDFHVQIYKVKCIIILAEFWLDGTQNCM